MSSDNGGIIGVVNDPTSTTASGVWQQEEQYEAKVNDTWPQRALFTTKSLRFNDDSSDYLEKNFSSTQDSRRKFTVSAWVKRSNLTTSTNIWGSSEGSGEGYNSLKFENHKLQYLSGNTSNSGTQVNLETNRLFRDVSAWYHIVLAVDTSQGTDSNRIKLYVNGSQETSFNTSTYPSQNIDLLTSTTPQMTIGMRDLRGNNAQFWDGYMCEVVFIDNQQLDPTSFGSTNSDGVWTPIPYTGTFGTNGFNLQFENSAALGTDSSPNGNTFTVNNLTSIDQTTDYPVVNFATFNSLWIQRANNVQPAFSNGNLTATFDNSNYNEQGVSTIGVSSGKWYAEIKWDSATANTATNTGIFPVDYFGGDPFPSAYIYLADGTIRSKNSASSYGNSYTTGDIIGIALDLDNNKLYFSKNGTFQNSGDPTSGSTGTGAISITADTYYMYCSDYASSGNRQASANFGNAPYSISSGNSDGNGYGNFEYAVPSGYYSLNSKNLAEYG